MEYPWTSDRAKTTMLIQSDFAEDAKYPNVDPCIVVEGGGISYTNDSIGNTAGMDVYKLAYVQQYYQFLARSTINIHCIAGSDDAAEELGFEVAMFMQSMRPISAVMLELQEFSMPSQSKPQLMTRAEWSGKYDSVVTVGYAFALRRKHTPIDIGELLADIQLEIETDKGVATTSPDLVKEIEQPVLPSAPQIPEVSTPTLPDVVDVQVSVVPALPVNVIPVYALHAGIEESVATPGPGVQSDNWRYKV